MNTDYEYKPFATKYRPQQLKDLVGQSALVKIINNSVLQNKLYHAYLLTGIRGIGKTTTARIIAKLVNCLNVKKEMNLVESCGNCVNCQNFASHPDIIEMDAASNTSVEDAKIIIEQAEYKPLLGKYKVFIIDEVHMLSKSAFNSLLKSIEEPNDNIIFIFATTEVNKIPSTIISRCQRFDLKRLHLADLNALINYVCEKENVNCEESAITVIAQKSEGSARDCLSILEQVAMSSNFNITKQSVEEVLGLASTGDIIKLLESILHRNLESAIDILDKLWDTNIDFVVLTESIIDLIGNIAKFKLTRDHLDPIHQDYKPVIESLSDSFDMSYLTIIWQIFSKSLGELKYFHDQKLYLEMTFIKAMYASTLPSIEKVLKEVKQSANKQNTYTVSDLNNSKEHVSSNIFPRVSIASKPKIVQLTEEREESLEHMLITILEFLYKKNEIDIYYYLMNDSEVTKIQNNTIYISGKDLDTKTRDKIINALRFMNNSQWSINFTKADSFQSFKNKMKDEFSKSKTLELISSEFPESKLVDVLLDA